MKKTTRRYHPFHVRAMLAVAVAGVSAMLPQADAADVFKNTSSANLNLGSSWVGGVAPNTSGVAVFDSQFGSGVSTWSLGADLNWMGIRLQSPLTGVTINSGNTLTLGSGGIDVQNASGVSLNLNNNLLLNGTGQVWTSGGTINVTGATNYGGGTLLMSGFGSTTVSGAMSNGSLLIVGGNLALSGNDNLTQIVASNSGYTTSISGTRTVGTFTLAGGNLNINSAGALGGGTFVLSTGTFDNLTGSPLTLNSVRIAGGATYTATNNITFGGTTTMAGGDGTLVLAAKTMTISGSLINDGTTRTLIKDGAGLLVVSATGNGVGLGVAAGTILLTGVSNSGARDFVGSVAGANAQLIVSGGTLTSTQGGVPSIRVGGNANGGVAGAIGDIRVTNNGVISTTSELHLGPGNGVYAALSQDSGTVTAGSYTVLGFNNDRAIVNQSGGVYVQNGNVITIGAGGTGSVGVWNMSGGTLAGNSNNGGRTIFVGETGLGIVNLSGGIMNLAGTLSMGLNAGNAVFNLNGGTITTPRVAPGGSSNIFNFNGGVLRAQTAANATFVGGLTRVTVWSGGTLVNDNGQALTITSALLAPTGSGISSIPLTSTGFGYIDTPVVWITGGGGTGATAVANVDANGNFNSITITNPGVGYTSQPTVNIYGGGGTGASTGIPVLTANSTLAAGGFTKLGTGTIALRAQNTYAGATTVNRGTLTVDFLNTAAVTTNIINASSALVVNGATLNILGIASTTAHSQTFAGTTIGPGGASAITMSAANFSSPTLLALGALAHTAGGFVSFNATSGTQLANNGITTSTANGNFAGGQQSILGGWATFTNTSTTGGFQTWAVSGTGSTPGNITGLSSFNSSLLAGADVSLAAGAYTTSSVATPLTINSLRFNDITGSYTIDATGGLTIASGGLMLTSNDTTSAHGVVISGGTITSGATELSLVQNNTINAVTLNSNIVGTLSVVKTGGGLLTLGGNNTYVGKTFLYGGTLAVAGGTPLGAAASVFAANQLTLAGTIQFQGNANLNVNTGVSLIGNTVVDTLANNVTFGGAVTTGSDVSFSLTKLGSGVLTLNGVNTYTGATTLRGGSLVLAGAITSDVLSQITVGDTSNSPAVLIINGGTVSANKNSAPSISVANAANGYGVIYLNSGQLTLANEIWVASGPNAADPAASSYGALIVNGGTLTAGSFIGIARGTTGNSAGVGLFQLSSGLVTVNANNLEIGSFQGTTGRLHAVAVLTGGTIGIATGAFIVGQGNSGITNMLGTNITANTTSIAQSAGQLGELNLNAGTLTTQVQWNAGPGILNFNGGTLKARSGTLVPSSANGTAYVWSGGAILDDGGFATTLAQALRTPASSAINGGDVTITNAGTGYAAGQIVTINASSNGAGTGATGLITSVNISNGAITGLVITNPGTGYSTNGPTSVFTVTSGTSSGATVSVNTVVAVQGVSSIPIVSGGTGFNAPPIVQINAAAGGGGTGATGYATIGTDGSLTGIIITNPGVGYNVGSDGTNSTFPTVTLIGGGGGGVVLGTINSSALTPTISGGLNKSGLGTLTLSSSASTYTGPTNLNAGTTIVSGTLNGTGLVTVAGTAGLRISGKVSGAITVNGGGILTLSTGGLAAGTAFISSGATLSGVGVNSAITGAVTVDGGGSVNMVDNASGVLTLNGGLILGNATTPASLKFDVNGALGFNDKIVTTSITVNGTNSTPITLNGVGLQPNTSYTLATFDTNSSLAGKVNLDANSTKFLFNSVSMLATGGSITITVTSISGKTTPVNAYWTGQFGAAWTATDAGVLNSNFNTDPVLNINAQQYPGTISNIIFVNTTTPSPTNLATSLGQDFGVNSVTVKNGMPAVSIFSSTSSANTLAIGAGGITNELGGGGLTISSLVSLSAAQTWANNDASSLIIVSGVISGVAGNTLSITGLVTLNGNNTYAGGTSLGAGTLTSGSNSALGATTGTLTLVAGLAGRLAVNGMSLAIGSLAGGDPNTIISNDANTNGTLTISPTGTSTYGGVLQNGTGSGTLSILVNGSGTETLTGATNAVNNFRESRGTVVVPTNAVITATGAVAIGNGANSSAVLNINGGVVNANSGAFPSLAIGPGNTNVGAVYVTNGGTLTSAFETAIAQAEGAYGALIIDGGVFNVASWVGLARLGGQGVLNVNAGTLTQASANFQIGADFVAGENANAIHAVATFAGGTTTIANGIIVTQQANGVMNLNGGKVIVNGTNGVAMFTLGFTGSAPLQTTTQTMSTTSIVNLISGTLTTQKFTYNNTASNVVGLINFNGGTLSPNINNATFLPAGNYHAYLQSGGAIIDDNGFAITIVHPLETPATQGVGSISITAGGTGFTSAPTVAIAGNGTGAAATALVSGGSVSGFIITNPGMGYTGAVTVTLTGPASSGGATTTVNLAASQGIATIPVSASAGGSGFVAPPIVQINPATNGGGLGATAIANINTVSGAITSITITNPGVGYNIITNGTSVTFPTATLIGGGGTGVTLGSFSLAPVIGGGLTKNGTGTVTLSSTTNTYTGTTNLNAGKLNLTGAITTSPTWNLNAGTLNVTGTLSAATAINVTGALNATGPVSTGALTINTGGLLTSNGTFSATTSVNLSGQMIVNGTAAVPVVNVNGGGGLGGTGTLTGTGTTGSLITLLGGSTPATRGSLNLQDNAAGTLTLVGTLTAGGTAGNSGGLMFDLGNGVSDLVRLGANPFLTNAGGARLFLTPSGALLPGQTYTLMTYTDASIPTVVLNSAFLGFNGVSLLVTNSSVSVTINSVTAAPSQAWFSGNASDGVWSTVINASLSNWNTDASSNIPVNQLPGATTDVHLVTSNPSQAAFNYTLGQNFDIRSLQVANNVFSLATIAGNSTLTIESGGLVMDSGQGGLNITANVKLGASQGWSNNTFTALTVGGVVSSNGSVVLTKTGSGQLILNNANTFNGTLTIAGGTVSLGNAAGLGNVANQIAFSPLSNAYLQLLNNNATIGGLSGDNSAIVEAASTSSVTLTVNTATTNTFAGVLRDGFNGGTLSLNKLGLGTLTLAGNNSYTGTTAVGAGVLSVGPGGVITAGTSSLMSVGNVAGANGVLSVDGGSISVGRTGQFVSSIDVGGTGGAFGDIKVNSGNLNIVSELVLGTGAGGKAAMTQAGGTVTLGNWFLVGQNNDRAIFNMSGGEFDTSTTAPNAAIQAMQVGNGGSNAVGVVNISGGSFNASGGDTTAGASIELVSNGTGLGIMTVSGTGVVNLSLGLQVGQGAGTAILNLDGGSLTTSRLFHTAGTGIVNFNGTRLIAQNGVNPTFVSGMTSAYIWAGSANFDDAGQAITVSQALLAPTGNGVTGITVTGATGFIDTPVVLISGGGGTGATAIANVNASGNLTSITITNPGVGYTSTPTVTITGTNGAANSTSGITVGAVTIGANGSGGGVNKYGTGTLTLSGTSTYTGPTNVNQGVLAVSANANLGDVTVGAPVMLNNTTLQAAGSFTMDTNGAGKRNIVLSGGGTIDTFAATNILTVTGNISGTGSLTLIGGGKVNVNGTSNVPIYVAPSTKLGGTGVVTAPVTVQDNGEINLNSGNLGTLTLSGGLTTTGSAAAFRFDLGGLSVTSVDTVNLTGSSLVLGSSGATVFLTNLGINPGTYNLMTFSSLSGGAFTLDFSSQQLGASTATLSTTATALVLTVAGAAVPGNAYWTGTQGSQWNTVNSGALTNFNNALSGGTDTHQIPGGITNVFFTATGGNNLSTSLGQDTAVRGITVLGTTTGAVSITGNTLYVGVGGLNTQAGSGGLSVSSTLTLTSNQTWSCLSTASALTVSSPISGNAALTFDGWISLTQTNTFVGPVTIKSGTLSLSGTNSLGDATNTLTFLPNSSATLQIGGAASLTIPSLSGDATAAIENGSATTRSLILNTTVANTFAGAIRNGTGGGLLNLRLLGSGSLTLSSTANSYTGVTTVSGGRLIVDGGVIVSSAASQITIGDTSGSNGVLEIKNGGNVTASFPTRPSMTIASANGAAGVIKVNGGNLTTSSEFWLGQQSVSSYAAMSMTSGVVSVGSWFVVGFNQSRAAFSMSGGQFDVHNAPTTIAAIDNPLGIGIFSISGGNYTSNDTGGNGGGMFLGEVGYAVLNVSGSALLTLGSSGVNSGLRIGVTNNVANSGIANLNGGTISVNSIQHPAANSVAVFNFNGGTLLSNATSTTFLPANMTRTTVWSGNASINDGGNAITIAAALTAPTGSGVTSINLTGSGVGFLDTPVIQISGGGGTGATAVAVVDAGGNLTGINITNPGVDYTSVPTVAIFANNGASIPVATASIAANDAGGGLFKSGAGTVILTGANSYNGVTNIVTGTLQVGGAGTTGSLGTGAVVNAGTLAVNRTDALTINNAISGAGGFTQAGTGTTTLSAYSGTGPLNVNAGRLALGGSAVPPTRTTALTIAGTPTAPTAALDIKDGGLIVTYTGSGTTQSSTMYSQIIAGKGTLDGSALFTYAGNGITSSTARTSNVTKGLNLFAVGVLNNADLTAFGVNPQYSAARPFMGQAVASNTVLARYTYAGDINLDGKINIDDYNYIDTAFASPTAYPGGWIAGDFNKDGKINIDDYNVIDTAFAFQGAPLGNGLTGLGDTSLVSLAAPSGGSAPVPEPTSLALLALGAVGLLARRKRR